MADMLTVNNRKTMSADAPARPERSRGSRNAVPSPLQTTGPLLRERREAMGVTLAEAEVATRIRQKYLAALESDEWDLLPGEVVGRGFLRNYATYLGLEATEMIERRRAVADDALSAVLVNTSAGTALPPERKVDYRPKDVALKDETNELETPRQLNLRPLLAVLAVLALVSLVWWGVTQVGSRAGDLVAAVQEQFAAVQAAVAGPAAGPTAARSTAGEAAPLPENLVAPTATVAVAAAPAAVVEATPVLPVEGAAPAAPALAEATTPAATLPAVEATPVATPAVTEAPVALADLLAPTPVPAAAEVAPAAAAPANTAATVATAANLRSGPGTDYPVVAGATEGQALTLVGRSEDSTWYLLDSGSWVFGQLVANPPTDLPVVAAPPLPAAPAAEAAPVQP